MREVVLTLRLTLLDFCLEFLLWGFSNDLVQAQHGGKGLGDGRSLFLAVSRHTYLLRVTLMLKRSYD